MRKMKNSGIEWIGEIPDNWKLERLQWHLSEIKEQNSPIKTRQILSLTNKAGVIPYENKGEQGNKSKENCDEYKLAYPQTIVANSMNILIGSVGICNYYGCVSPVYYVFKPNNNENIEFLNYIFQLKEFQKELRKYAAGILEIRLRLSSSDILKRQVAFPSKGEQDNIVAFLDKKLSEVDKLIEVQQAQIEKLKEYKQSVITEAVTKGLDPFAPMKDSGIEWLGKIQTTFLVEPLKFLLCEPMMYGANEKGDKTKEYYRYIRITDIESDGGLKESDDNQYLTHDVGCYYELRDGDVLFARSGGTVGKSFIFNESYGKCAFAGYLIKASCNVDALLPEYLYYYTQSSIYERWKNSVFIQATIQNIGANKFSMLPIVICSIDEQSKIVYAIKNKCAKIDKLIALKQEKIEKLNEYKKSLIYEYVTGKKEVV